MATYTTSALDRLEALRAFAMVDKNNGARYLPLTPEQVAALLDSFTVREWHAMAVALIDLNASV